MPSDSAGRLLLLGVVHRDPRIIPILISQLRQHGSRVIACEASPYAVRFRQRCGARMRAVLRRRARLALLLPPDQPLPPFVTRFLAAEASYLVVPAEVRAAHRTATLTGARVELLGDSERSRRLIGEYLRDLYRPRRLLASARRARADKDRIRLLELEYRKARRTLGVGRRSQRPRIPVADPGSLEPDDRHTALRLLTLARQYEGPMAYICGWQHLAAGDLQRRVGDLVAGSLFVEPG